MKILGELHSKRGHGEIDYLCSLTPKEIFIIKNFILIKGEKSSEKYNKLRSVQNAMQGEINKKLGKLKKDKIFKVK